MEKDSKIIAREVKIEYWSTIVGWSAYIVLLVLILDLGVLVHQIINNKEYSHEGFVNLYYEKEANRLQSNPIILEISDKCEDSVNPVECVFNEIPMNYDFSRVGVSLPIFRNPSDYFKFGGVCRDYTLLRQSALSNLGIHCMFDFSQEGHVFLVCSYDGKFYQLNNGYFGEID